MCTTCGCGSDTPVINSSKISDAAIDGHKHEHNHSHAHGTSSQRIINIEKDILSKNDHYAQLNREIFQKNQLQVFNLVSSPGSGKTELLTRTIKDNNTELRTAVIEGDQQTSNDAERIRSTGAAAIQINTGKGCHLDAHMVGHALEQLAVDKLDTVFIENVGNLVCPAAFDLGEIARVVILSVTEGEDKPLKYPDIFHGSDLMLINKMDLLPYVDFDINTCIEYARRINPDIEVIQCSAKTGAGMNTWYQWIKEKQSFPTVTFSE